jgi:hypothetical protein
MMLYGLTIFCGAFLLFLVQPLMGKCLLPWAGGVDDLPAVLPNPADWWLYNNTWMLLTTDAARLAVPEIHRAAGEPPDATAEYVLWTDDHASLFSVIK